MPSTSLQPAAPIVTKPRTRNHGLNAVDTSASGSSLRAPRSVTTPARRAASAPYPVPTSVPSSPVKKEAMELRKLYYSPLSARQAGDVTRALPPGLSRAISGRQVPSRPATPTPYGRSRNVSDTAAITNPTTPPRARKHNPDLPPKVPVTPWTEMSVVMVASGSTPRSTRARMTETMPELKKIEYARVERKRKAQEEKEKKAKKWAEEGEKARARMIASLWRR